MLSVAHLAIESWLMNDVCYVTRHTVQFQSFANAISTLSFLFTYLQMALMRSREWRHECSAVARKGRHATSTSWRRWWSVWLPNQFRPTSHWNRRHVPRLHPPVKKAQDKSGGTVMCRVSYVLSPVRLSVTAVDQSKTIETMIMHANFTVQRPQSL